MRIDGNIDIAEWYDRYGPMVLRRCRSILRSEDEALDAMQDVFVEVLRRRETIRNDYPSSYLYTVATNVCLNRATRKRETPIGLSELEKFPAADPAVERIEARDVLSAIFSAESESNRLIAWLYHVDGLTLEEIGRTSGMSVSGVRKRLLGLADRARRIAGENHGKNT